MISLAASPSSAPGPDRVRTATAVALRTRRVEQSSVFTGDVVHAEVGSIQQLGQPAQYNDDGVRDGEFPTSFRFPCISTGQPYPLIFRRVLPGPRLAGSKLLALFGRGEPRDFLDVRNLLEHYSTDELVALAERFDAGFDRRVLAGARAAGWVWWRRALFSSWPPRFGREGLRRRPGGSTVR
jgi:hypothetical protein